MVQSLLAEKVAERVPELRGFFRQDGRIPSIYRMRGETKERHLLSAVLWAPASMWRSIPCPTQSIGHLGVRVPHPSCVNRAFGFRSCVPGFRKVFCDVSTVHVPAGAFQRYG